MVSRGTSPASRLLLLLLMAAAVDFSVDPDAVRCIFRAGCCLFS